MTIKEIKELVELFHESGVGEMEVQRGQNRLRLTRSASAEEIASSSPSSHRAAPAQPAAPASMPAAPPPAPVEDETQTLVRSPIVGTYYDAPSPGAPVFVKVGDRVSAGQVLCIIESMKLMNEIEAEEAGVIASKLVENGRPVEYGEALFALQRD